MLSVLLHLLSGSSGQVQRRCFGLSVVLVIVESALSIALGTTKVSSSVSLLISSNVTVSQDSVTEACRGDWYATLRKKRIFTAHRTLCFSARASVS